MVEAEMWKDALKQDCPRCRFTASLIIDRTSQFGKCFAVNVSSRYKFTFHEFNKNGTCFVPKSTAIIFHIFCSLCCSVNIFSNQFLISELFYDNRVEGCPTCANSSAKALIVKRQSIRNFWFTCSTLSSIWLLGLPVKSLSKTRHYYLIPLLVTLGS